MDQFRNSASVKYVFTNQKRHQRNQTSSGYQKNVTEGQRPDLEKRHTQQRT